MGMKRFLIFTILAFCINGVYGQPKSYFKGRDIKRPAIKRSVGKIDPKIRSSIRESHRQQLARGQKKQRGIGSVKGLTPSSIAHHGVRATYEFGKKKRQQIVGEIVKPQEPNTSSFNSNFRSEYEAMAEEMFNTSGVAPTKLLPENRMYLKSALHKYPIIQLLLNIRHTNPHEGRLQFLNLLEHHIAKSNNARPENWINKNNAVQQRARAYFNKVEKRENSQEITSRHPDPQRIEIENNTIVHEPSNLLQENKEFQIEQVKESMSDWQLKLMEKVYQKMQKINISIIKGNIHTLYGDNLVIDYYDYYSNYAA